MGFVLLYIQEKKNKLKMSDKPITPKPPGFIVGFPAPGLRQMTRHITGHNESGKAIFIKSDSGDHQRVVAGETGVSNIIYATKEVPANLEGDDDIKTLTEQEPPLFYNNGSVVRVIDFAPGAESPVHRTITIDYGIVLDGVFELTLGGDENEKRILRQGDVCIQRATAQKWKNISGNGTAPGRMLWVLLGSKDVVAGGEKLECFLGDLGQVYEKNGVSD